MDLVVLVFVLFVVVVVSVALEGAASRRAKAIEARSDSDRAHELLEAMKRMTSVALVCGVICGGAAYLVLLVYGSDAVNWGSGPAQVVAAIGGFAGAGLPIVLARRPFVLAYERVRDLRKGAVRAPRRMLAQVTILVLWLVPIGIALALPISQLIGALLVVVAGLIVSPLASSLGAPLIARVLSTGDLPADAGEVLSGLSERAGLRVRGRLVTAAERRAANASLVGWMAGARFILVTNYLIENLTAGQLEAVLAHELGHARHYDWLRRQLISAPAFVVFGLIGLFFKTGLGNGQLLVILAGVAMSFGVLRLARGLAVRAEYAADQFASGVVEPLVLADALERLTTLNDIKRDTSQSWDRHVGHPATALRIVRLRKMTAAATADLTRLPTMS